MNVLFASNDICYTGLELAIYTLLTHNPYNVNIYVFTMDYELEHSDYIQMFKSLEPWQREKLKKIVRYLSCGKSHIFIKDVKEPYEKYLAESVNKFTNFTPFTSLRLLADIVLPHVDYCYQLDCDVVVNGNITSYYEKQRQQDILYGAYITPDACEGKGEMVAGVMFMNLRRMRNEGFLERARMNYNQNEYIFPDQCALRDAGGAPESFPATLGYCEDLYDCKELPLILHFTNKISPKIYCAPNRESFFRKFTFLKYAKEGIEKLDTFNA